MVIVLFFLLVKTFAVWLVYRNLKLRFMLKSLLVYKDHGQGPFPNSKQIGFPSVLNPLTSSCKEFFFFSSLNQYVIQRAGDENRNSAEGYNLDITPNSTYSYTRKCGTNGREKLDFVFWNNIGNESVKFSSFFHPFPSYFSFYWLLFD